MIKSVADEKSLDKLFPELLKYWDYEKNDTLSPQTVSPGSRKKVWWICDRNHSFQMRLFARTCHPQNTGCPFCSGNKVLAGFNDLETLYPRIASEWDDSRNGDLKPSAVTSKSSRIVWWKDSLGHEWSAMVQTRTNGSGCPFCTGKKVLVGFNDLATVYPERIKEWNYSRNADRKPQDFTAHSGMKVWWICEKGHEWKASITSRRKTSCPYCSGKYIISGINDFETLRPDIAAEWHPTKNGELQPSQFSAYSRKKVWWIGKCGHEWETSIQTRYVGHNCPLCSRKKL